MAWFDEIKAAYERSKSNQQADEIHQKAEKEAEARVAQLREERGRLEGSLTEMANASGVSRGELTDLMGRTQHYLEAVDALQGLEDQLQAPRGMDLPELESQLAGCDYEQLVVDGESTRDALREAEKAAETAHALVIEAKNNLAQLKGRTGADALQQELSQATAEVLEIIEDYATTQLMHHLLTQELRAYLESHRNPVLERAGSY